MSAIEYSIANLRDFPQFVPELARWHHSEWLKGYADLARRQTISDKDVSKDIHERELNLHSHFGEAPVPSTFIAVCDKATNGSAKPEVIGSVSIVYYKFSHHRVPSEWLTNLYVLDAFRKQGIGEKLLEFMSDFAAENKIEQLKLYTKDKENFYRKRNWAFSHKGLVQGSAVTVLEKRFY